MQFLDYFLEGQRLTAAVRAETEHERKVHLLDELSKTRFTLNLCIIFGAIVLFTLSGIVAGSYPYIPNKAYTLLLISIYYFALPFFYKWNGNDLLLRVLVLGGGFLAVCYRALATHGIDSAPFYWLCLIPLCSALMFEKKMIYISLGASILASFIIFNGEKLGIFFGTPHPMMANYTAFVGLIITTTFTAIAFDRQSVKFQNQLVEQEKKFQDTKKLASLGNMAAGVAHEINNPLTVITGNLHQLERSVSNLNLEQEDYLKVSNHISKASNNVARIGKIVQSLLSYSRMKSKDSFKSFTLAEFITDLQTVIKDQDQIHDIQWDCDNHTLGSLKLYGDYTLLCQVFTNLIYNAWQATRERQDFKIVVNCQKETHFLVFRIIDQGKIEDQDIIDNMFNPFFTTKEIGEGTGLGLSLSKGIIELHEGELFYDRTHPTSCFVLKLPYPNQ